jgi:hypothetical protein
MICDFQVSLGTDVLDGQDGGRVAPSSHLLNSPNPFNPATSISYGVERSGWVELDLFNILGKHVRTLVAEDQTAGVRQVTWDGTDQAGRSVSSGVYLAQLRSGGHSTTRKMVLVR